MPEKIKDLPNKKPRLGRGLGSLLGTSSKDDQASTNIVQGRTLAEVGAPLGHASSQTFATESEHRVWQIAIEKLSPSEFQPRRQFTKESLEQLADSIRKNGIIQPILARKVNDHQFSIVAGERRWRAAQLAGLHTVPVILKTLENQKTLELAIIENVQREDLNPIDAAEAYQRLISEFQLSQEEVAVKVAKDRTTITNALRLLNLTPECQDLVRNQSLSAGHARALLGIREQTIITQLAKQTVTEGLSVRTLEKLVQKHKKSVSDSTDKPEVPAGPKANEKMLKSLVEDLQKQLGTKTDIDYQDGKGRLILHFYSDAELNDLVERIQLACQRN